MADGTQVIILLNSISSYLTELLALQITTNKSVQMFSRLTPPSPHLLNTNPQLFLSTIFIVSFQTINPNSL